MNHAYTVAVTDDDASVRSSLETLLRSAGWRVLSFASPKEFLHSGAEAVSSCLVLDVDMPGMSGPEVFEVLQKRGCSLPVVFMTGHLDEYLRKKAAGAAGFFLKPFDGEELLERIEAVARPADADLKKFSFV